jgi:formylglycine-generating enzyme required for sulfatase activity
VKAADRCHGNLAGYQDVYDLAGNVSEWTGVCTPAHDCLAIGAGYNATPVQTTCFDIGYVMADFQFGDGLGFRCCAD